jgi:hypothetical protein
MRVKSLRSEAALPTSAISDIDTPRFSDSGKDPKLQTPERLHLSPTRDKDRKDIHVLMAT